MAASDLGAWLGDKFHFETSAKLTLCRGLCEGKNSISRQMVIERHGEKSDELKVFQQMVCSQLR